MWKEGKTELTYRETRREKRAKTEGVREAREVRPHCSGHRERGEQILSVETQCLPQRLTVRATEEF